MTKHPRCLRSQSATFFMTTLSLLWPLNRGWVQQSCCTSCTLRASFRSSAWFGRNWSLHSTGLEAKNREKSQIAKKLNKYGHRFIKRVEKNLLANISWFVLSCCKGRGKENIPILIWRYSGVSQWCCRQLISRLCLTDSCSGGRSLGTQEGRYCDSSVWGLFAFLSDSQSQLPRCN